MAQSFHLHKSLTGLLKSAFPTVSGSSWFPQCSGTGELCFPQDGPPATGQRPPMEAWPGGLASAAGGCPCRHFSLIWALSCRCTAGSLRLLIEKDEDLFPGVPFGSASKAPFASFPGPRPVGRLGPLQAQQTVLCWGQAPPTPLGLLLRGSFSLTAYTCIPSTLSRY